MEDFAKHKNNIAANGFTVIDQLFTNTEIETIIQVIDEANSSNPAFIHQSDGDRQTSGQMPRVILSPVVSPIPVHHW